MIANKRICIKIIQGTINLNFIVLWRSLFIANIIAGEPPKKVKDNKIFSGILYSFLIAFCLSKYINRKVNKFIRIKYIIINQGPYLYKVFIVIILRSV